MTLDQLKLLLDAGVEMEFIVTPAVLERGYWVTLRRGYELSTPVEPLSTRRDPKQYRLFKSLDAVFSLLVIDLEQDFMVHGGASAL